MPGDDRIPPKLTPTTLRLVTFNVNGIKTLRNYFPWTLVSNYSQMLNMMNVDVVAFQELKVQRPDIDLSIADVDGYHSFISVPISKKGYSGVGVYVRKPRDDEPGIVKKCLTVVRVEEGITGILPHQKKHVSFKEAYSDPVLRPTCIGGYPDHKNMYDKFRKLDSEGRCVIIELNFNIVVISVYCPANSLGTDEGEEFRLLFLRCLFERARNLRALGKKVVVMGDINVCVDLIDSDDTIKQGFKERRLVKAQDYSDFETLNADQVLAFKHSAPHRELVNQYVKDTTGMRPDGDSHVLHDVVREKHGRRLKMYTVWSTFKSNRPLNIGSRIDLILASSQLARLVSQADIWPFLHGSDHCPVHADFELADLEFLPEEDRSGEYAAKSNWFEAKNFYGLHTRGSIDKFFRKREPQRQEKVDGEGDVADGGSDSATSGYSFRKRARKERPDQLSISDFFFRSDSSPPSVDEDRAKSRISVREFTEMLGQSGASGPQCRHGEPCALRTVKTEKNKGKKFWCCPRATRSVSWLPESAERTDADATDEYNCGFFKWASK
ncbi:uncharacterized protein OGAPODRAFT_9880 [Ogataea polymorpha]|uniref:uncharacterized protein n=1 Tax=Ogataea polymorpha TaxID=460523 RepID=UPI0007F4E757|nr:uncharacterized protein OGAPODRAFT_9880 [Ogataea polymorpha]KAG7936487.1 hypothetical protein KL934_001954 [Ogataea polymorpha]OBA14347.1 hypothetical protein OGAPODRAFT_9880 [Ogataea polymorpha]